MSASEKLKPLIEKYKDELVALTLRVQHGEDDVSAWQVNTELAREALCKAIDREVEKAHGVCCHGEVVRGYTRPPLVPPDE